MNNGMNSVFTLSVKMTLIESQRQNSEDIKKAILKTPNNCSKFSVMTDTKLNYSQEKQNDYFLLQRDIQRQRK